MADAQDTEPRETLQNAHTDAALRRSRRVTASDVAKAAGMSRPAVSRAFTPGAYLDKDKRKLILKTALELGYRPNALAASLNGGRSNLVGIVTGALRNPYDSDILAQLLAGLNDAGKWPLVLGGGEVVAEDAFLSMLNYPLDALIIRGGSVPISLVENCAKLSIPVLFTGKAVEAPFIDCVCCRNAMGAALAVETLLARGRKAFGFLGGPESFSSSREREEGMRARLATAGLTPVAVRHTDYSYEDGQRVARTLLSEHRIDALVCANDSIALGALCAARNELGRRVPEDLSIIGFDDIAMASWPDFALTTLRNPVDETVAALLHLLEARLDDPEKPGEIRYIEPVLMARGTH